MSDVNNIFDNPKSEDDILHEEATNFFHEELQTVTDAIMQYLRVSDIPAEPENVSVEALHYDLNGGWRAVARSTDCVGTYFEVIQKHRTDVVVNIYIKSDKQYLETN